MPSDESLPISLEFLRKLKAQAHSLQVAMIAEIDDNSQRRAVYIFSPAAPIGACSVLFHGMGNDAIFGWEKLILSLLNSGRVVLCFDMNGHGCLSSTRLNAEKFWNSANFLPQVLKEHLPSTGKLEAIGYSVGALIAARLACEGRLNWQKLVLIAIPERIDLSLGFIGHELLTLFAKSYWQDILEYGWRARIPALGQFRRKAFPLRFEDQLSESYPNFVQKRLEEWRVGEHLKNLTMPTLLVCGEQDELARPAYTQSLLVELPAGKLTVMANTNHFLLQMHHQIPNIILQWLE